MPVKIAPRSKYHATPLTIDGVRFASTREARRYGELRLLERAGKIWDLTLQPSFDLHAPAVLAASRWARGQLIGVYRADFAYATKEGTIIEDAKGVRTALYTWKKKHVEAEYGVRIVEV
jgi:hypothetical protein